MWVESDPAKDSGWNETIAKPGFGFPKNKSNKRKQVSGWASPQFSVCDWLVSVFVCSLDLTVRACSRSPSSAFSGKNFAHQYGVLSKTLF